MRKIITLLFCFCLFYSCIPIRVAPTISDYKLISGKKFKRGLPKKTTFVFEDPKDAGEFYDYINIKFDLEDYYVDTEVPFKVDTEEYFFSFYEVEIDDKAINLLPLVFDIGANVALGNDNFQAYTVQNAKPVLRSGNWYIAIEAFSKTEKDCLGENSVSREKVLPYLRALKEEYLSTDNYNEVVFKN